MCQAGVPQIQGTILGVPIRRTIISRGLNWGPLFRETTICDNDVRFLE